MSFELWIFNVTIFSLSFTEFLEPPLIANIVICAAEIKKFANGW
jgi:hypothetical protein